MIWSYSNPKKETSPLTVSLSEAKVHLKIFEQTAKEGRKRWGKELGRKHGAAALRKYAADRGKELTLHIGMISRKSRLVDRKTPVDILDSITKNSHYFCSGDTYGI